MKEREWRPLLQSRGVRRSTPRDQVVEIFLSQKGHLSAEELLTRVRERNRRVGLATVYRTLKLLSECGLAIERKFNRQISTFEPAVYGKHHDHLICLRCGAIEEFTEPGIEALQERVARSHGFQITDHKLELYGHCRKCAAVFGRRGGSA